MYGIITLETCDMKTQIKSTLSYPDSEEGFNRYRLDSLDNLWDKYQEKLAKCRKEFSEDSVHKFRISARKFLAMIDMVDNLYESKYIDELRKLLKKQLKIFANLRDTQVMINAINEIRKEFSVFDFFYYELLAHEQTYIKKIEKKIKRVSKKEVEALIFFLRMDLDDTFKKDDATFNDALAVIDSVFADMSAKLKLVDPERPQTIHDIRLMFKKFRYMIEAFAISLDIPEPYLKSLSDYQTLMGEVQDAEVLILRFKEYILTQDNPNDIIWSNAIKVLEERLAEKIRKFVNNKERLFTFWTI